jgi:hypothetical protein
MNGSRRTPKLLAGDLPAVGELLRELSLPAEAAELRAFADLCRRSLRVRAWLFGRFAREPATQAAFRLFLADSVHPSPWRRTPSHAARAVSGDPPSGEGSHGGLSEMQILALIKGYQAGSLDVMAFVLIRLWRRFLGTGGRDVPVTLQAATAKYWTALASDNTGRMARDLSDVLQFFRERSGRAISEADFGHACSWKIHLLVHILDHPRPRYRLGELHESLPAKYRHVDRRELRDCCVYHGIRRDQKAGRPPGAPSKPRNLGRMPGLCLR